MTGECTNPSQFWVMPLGYDLHQSFVLCQRIPSLIAGQVNETIQNPMVCASSSLHNKGCSNCIPSDGASIKTRHLWLFDKVTTQRRIKHSAMTNSHPKTLGTAGEWLLPEPEPIVVVVVVIVGASTLIFTFIHQTYTHTERKKETVSGFFVCQSQRGFGSTTTSSCCFVLRMFIDRTGTTRGQSGEHNLVKTLVFIICCCCLLSVLLRWLLARGT